MPDFLTRQDVANLSHFAPPRQRMMIEGMTEKELFAAMFDEWAADGRDGASEICEIAARVAHRLATTPAPEVDEHAGAKDALWRYWCAVPGRNPHATKEAAWRETADEDKSRWINFVAMEKGNG